ncbi:MAG TPA: APC family permease [Thermoleophilia bacterium]|nr:APC family permease [Thermoleophilia bacterium]
MTELLRNQGLKRVRMRLFTAVIVVFTLTCSGSFGMEDVVSSSGPGLTLLMIVVLPFVWSVPMAFVASEMGSMIPEAGGSYRWVRRAMGEYWSFQSGWWWTLSVFIDSAVYVALALGYIQSQLNLTSLERWLVGVGIIAVFTVINIRGLELTGWSLTVIQVVVMVPFLIFTILAFMRGTGAVFSPFQPAGQNVVSSMNLGLAIMMWMYAGWESMSTLAGEIENPQKVIPRALMVATPIVIITYFVTVAALIRAGGAGNWSKMVSDASSGGTDYIVAAKIVGGAFLGWLMFASAIASNIGLYAGYLASGARPPFQISRDRLLFRFFGTTSKKYGTPYVAILIFAGVNCALIAKEFTALIVMDIFLLMFAYILVFISAIVLRIKEPDTPRPFRVPLPTWALAIWVAIPIAIAVFALFTNGSDYLVGGLIGVLSGPIAYLVFKYLYHGTTDRALEGATITPEGEITQFGAEIEGVQA